MRTIQLVFVSTILVSGCATKGYVAEQLDGRASGIETGQAELGDRVEELQQALDTAEATIQRQSALLGEVDSTAGNAFALATSAGEGVEGVNARAAAIEEANRRLVFEVVISDSHDQFMLSDSNLPEAASGAIDRFVDELRQLPTASHLEIEGHTDASGEPHFNETLGLARAEQVRRYLHQNHQLPLHKMSVISYGEDRPVASNDDREGRARNRRVVLRVLG